MMELHTNCQDPFSATQDASVLSATLAQEAPRPALARLFVAAEGRRRGEHSSLGPAPVSSGTRGSLQVPRVAEEGRPGQF